MFNDWSTSECVVDGVATLRCIFPLFENVVTAALIFAGIVAVIFIIVAGIKLIRSAGDQKQVQGARQTLTYAIIGLILVFLSYFIVNSLAYITGTECIKTFGFDSCK